MKLLLAQPPRQRSVDPFAPANEALRLAAEIYGDEGDCPAIDVPGARLRHWNGQPVAVAKSDLAALIARGVLAPNGRWTDHGRRELATIAETASPK